MPHPPTYVFFCVTNMLFSVRLTYVCCDMVKEVTAYVGHLGIVMMADDGGGVMLMTLMTMMVHDDGDGGDDDDGIDDDDGGVVKEVGT